MTGIGGPYIKDAGRVSGTEDDAGFWGDTGHIEVEGRHFSVTIFKPTKPVPKTQIRQESSKHELEKVEEIISPAELALIRALRLCGDEYKKRIYAAAAIRGQNTMEERELTDEQKAKHRKDLEALLTTSIE